MLPHAPRQYLAIGLFATIILLFGFSITNSYYQLIMTQVLLWAMLGLSWNLLSGYSGLVSFGHAAFFGLSGYTMTILFVKYNLTPWIGIPIGVLVSLVAGIVIGIPTFRLKGDYFALSMLAYPLSLLYVFEWLGYQEVALPMIREAPGWYAQFSDPRVYMIISLALLVAFMVLSLVVERSRFGMSLLAIKQNEAAAEAAGIDTWRWKMLAMALSASMAGVAGGLYALVLLVVTPPTMFGMMVSAQALIVTLFGGVGIFWGPIIGAFTLVPLAEVLHAELGHILPGIQGVVYGVAIVAVILLAPEGIYWNVRDRLIRRRGGGEDTAVPVPLSPAAEPATPKVRPPRGPAAGQPFLRLQNVSKSFGGLKAVDGVTLDVEEGLIHGIIGPNGAGKTTLFNIINGFLPSSTGSITFAGQELIGLKPHQICALFVGRTFQVVRSFPRMTTAENVVVGAYVGTKDDQAAARLAGEALERVGLAGFAATRVSALTTKQLRMMELARALAPKPRILLLDETLAGLGHEELDDLLQVVRDVNAEGTTIVIIEHTMHAMVKLADRFSVLDHGKLIADGTPSEVVRNPLVIEAYLGKKWANRAEHSFT